MKNDMSLVTLTHRVLPQGAQLSYPLSTWHLIYLHYYIVRMFNPVSVQCGQKNISGTDHIRDQKGSQRGRTRLLKQKIDDGRSSKTHLVRLMHNVVRSKFRIPPFRDESKTHVAPVMTIFMTYTVVITNTRNQM